MKIKRNIDEIINNIVKVLNEPNSKFGFDSCMETFKYTENIKSSEDSSKLEFNPSITLIGTEKVKKYNELFKDLYESMDAKSRKISFKVFKKNSQQLLFTNKFNASNILQQLNGLSTTKYNFIYRIYGMSINENFTEFSKYIFVNKKYIEKYIEANCMLEKGKVSPEYSLKVIKQFKTTSAQYVCLIIPCEAYDSDFAKEETSVEFLTIINVLRYMAGIKNERVYISEKEFVTYRELSINYTKENLCPGIQIIRKDIDVNLNSDYFFSNNYGNAQIWDILNKNFKTDLERRILKAIHWVGISIYEEMNDISCTELSFAFEALFKRDISISPISASIQGNIAEMVAYLSGNTLEERKNIIKDFKEFYSFRSSIVHGGEKKYNNGLYFNMLSLIKNTITTILTNKNYLKCKTLEDVVIEVEKYKFRI